MSRPVKRSLTLRGHRTSVSLEDGFWRAFRALAEAEGRPVNVLAAEIDAAREPDTGLATAIRLFVLEQLQAELTRRRNTQDRGAGDQDTAGGQC